ncbi:MAG: metallophosphoesterase [Phycisphaerae bacterium]|nr:metallophosphoesterase [Phycisphaerae bacterium]
MKKMKIRSLICIVLLASIALITGCQTEKTADAGYGKWHFVVVGDSRGSDTGVNTEILSEVAAELVGNDPDFVLFPGDLVNGSGDSEKHRAQLTKWREIMQPVYDAKINVYAVRGNHDKGPREGGLDIWNDIFSGPYAMPGNGPAGEEKLTYSVVHNNALVLVLDQYATKGQKNNQAWIDMQFAKSGLPHVFVMGHEPAFAVKHKDCLDDNAAKRNEFLDSITREGGRIYFCGHDHFYDHISADNDGDPSNDIHQFIVGTAGAPIYSHDGKYSGDNEPYKITPVAGAAKYGYLIVTVDGSDVTTTWVERIGKNDFQPRDSWSYSVTEAR